MTDITQIEEKIRSFVRMAQDNNVPIVSRRWNVYWSHEEAKYKKYRHDVGCCAMGCVLVFSETTGTSHDVVHDAALTLGISDSHAYAFIAGFDGCGLGSRIVYDAAYTAMYELGKKLREEYVIKKEQT